MKRSFFHQLFSSMLALLVVVSTLSFTVEKHFCGNHLIDTAIFSEVKKCGMGSMEISDESSIKKSCCKDEVDVVKGQDDLTHVDSETFQDFQKDLLIYFVLSYPSLLTIDGQEDTAHKHYDPPNLVMDISIRDQVFLI